MKGVMAAMAAVLASAPAAADVVSVQTGITDQDWLTSLVYLPKSQGSYRITISAPEIAALSFANFSSFDRTVVTKLYVDGVLVSVNAMDDNLSLSFKRYGDRLVSQARRIGGPTIQGDLASGDYSVFDYLADGAENAFRADLLKPQGSGDFDFTLTLETVPEPSTWAMMVLGFGATAIRARRSQRFRFATLPYAHRGLPPL